MPISLKRYIKDLAACGLMSVAEIKQFQANLAPGDRPRDAEDLARLLVRRRRLTRYQAARIYEEQADGLVLGNYEILDCLGAGGMGQVFKARHRRLDRVVALKILPAASANSADAVQRFRREGKAAARLDHPHVVTTHDADEAGGVHFLVMEHIDGPNLGDLVRKRGPLPVAEAVDYTIQAARGLAYAHARGVVHRDVKPANLLLAPDGVVKLLDLGLARLQSDPNDRNASGALTTTGQVVGTVEYMAPEQAEDTRQADVRADVYSLGCTLYRLLTGQLLYPGETVVKIILAHREHPIPSLCKARRDVPRALDAIFRRMVAKTPEERYPRMTEVIAALTSLALVPVAANDSAISLPGAQEIGDGDAEVRSEASDDTDPPDAPTPARRKDSTAGRAEPPVERASDGRRVQWAVATLLLAGGAVWTAFSGNAVDQPGPAIDARSQGSPAISPATAAGQQALCAEQLGLPRIVENSLGMPLALVPPGEFWMGSREIDVFAAMRQVELQRAAPPAWLAESFEREAPRHRVQITQPFYLGQFEVTVGQFALFLAERPVAAEPAAVAAAAQAFNQSDSHPAAQVSRDQAEAFCQWLSDREDCVYQLPTEAQWEYACRAGGDMAWSPAADPGDLQRWAWSAANAEGRTHRVGLLEANAFGLHDLQGNVLEWCGDAPRTYTESYATDPVGPGRAPGVLRGGAWNAPFPLGVRASARLWRQPADAGSLDSGFRVLRTIAP